MSNIDDDVDDGEIIQNVYPQVMIQIYKDFLWK